MNKREIAKDDLMDVMEMTHQLEAYMSEVLTGNETALAMSALMSACINTVIYQSKNIDIIIDYRNLFIEIFDVAIKQIKERNQR